MSSALSEQASNPEQEARQEFGFRYGIGIRVEEMGYEFPPWSAERRTCFAIAEDIKSKAQELLDARQ